MSEYTECMIPWMKGEKQIDGISAMCIGAKICTGKAKTKEEAIQICKTQPPKEHKSRSKRGFNATALAACLLPKLTDEITVAELAKMLTECSTVVGGKIKKADTYKTFMKQCVKEGTVTGTQQETIKLIKQCTVKWKAEQSGETPPVAKPKIQTDDLVEQAMMALK